MAAKAHSPAFRPASRVVRLESSELRRSTDSRLRAQLVAGFFCFSFVMLAMRLVEVTMVGTGEYPFKRLVTEPQLLLAHDDDYDASKSAAPPASERREIVDRNGNTLATSVRTASLVANPTIIRHESEVARALHRIFPELATGELQEKLLRKKTTFLYVRRHLTPSQQEAVNNLGVPGLFFEPDSRRVYPYGALFAQVLGYVGVDNQGLGGIEKNFESQLTEESHAAPLQLSLDLRVQAMLREELKRSMNEFRAIGAMGLVMDIRSGELLAMVSLPEFDPNQPGRSSDEARFNRATLGVYEMGSTFKSFTFAAALEHHVASLRSQYDASAPIHVGSFTINDAHSEGRSLTLPEIFAYSSNIGTAHLAMDLGARRQQDFLRSLGLFSPVSLEVPELGRPIVPRSWLPVTTMTVAYGHGISVSPLHLIRAIAGITGDGTLPTPTLLKSDGARRASRPRVVSAATVAQMRDLLRLVVLHGTGKFANAPGYEVGGKTGTAEKNAGGVYRPDAKIASFVGVFPITDPRFAVLVMVDEPKGTAATHGNATGGWVSAPAVGRLVPRIGPLLGLGPHPSGHDAQVEALWQASDTAHKNPPSDVDPEGGVHATAF